MPTILVVDDSAPDRIRIGGLLKKLSNTNVVFASNGVEALEAIEDHVPDLVLTDLQMPEMDGLELVSTIKKDYRLIPVIILTGAGSETIAVEALQQGAASYVSKSRMVKDLIDIIDRVKSTAEAQSAQTRLMTYRMTRSVTEFCIENDPALISSLVSYLQEEVTRMRFCDETERLRVGIALDEAILNAYYHGNLEISSELREQDHEAYYKLAEERRHMEPYQNRRIYITSTLTPEKATYVVRDEGIGFDPGMLPDPSDPANLEKPCGRGVLLMKTFMDEVRFNEAGNEVTLVKHRSKSMGEDEDE
ncbi:MAG: response regulator [Planctomycetaceae bacterium]|nr:response regulator [Planctomycetaceae bacterium]